MPISIKTKAELDNYLKEDQLVSLVAVDFSTEWCGPCQAIAPYYEELSKEHTDVIFLKVDGDDCPDIVNSYDITAYPTFCFFKGCYWS